MDSPLLFHIFQIFLEMKVGSSSSSDSFSDSSSEESSKLRGWGKLLDADFEDDSLEGGSFLVFWTLRAKDFPS